MNYISQTILFALALMGTLFKSTKTDAQGKTMHAASGLPVLTRTGKTVVSLLSISFIVSLATIWQKNLSEDRAKQGQEELKAYNKGIDDTLNKVFARTTQLSDEQKSRFQDVLAQQEATGNRIAIGINSSSDLLRTRIESYSTLLGSRIGTSIDLLKSSGSKIESLTAPINTISMELLIEIPLTDSALGIYTSRVEPVMRELLDSGGLKSQDDIFRLGLEKWEALYPVYIANHGVSGIYLCPDSQFLPQWKSELDAYLLLSSLRVDIFLVKGEMKESLLASIDSTSDLTIPILGYLRGKGQSQDRCDMSSDSFLLYDLDQPRVFIYVRKRLTKTDRYLDGWYKRAGGRISGIPDLAGSQVVVRFAGVRDASVLSRLESQRMIRKVSINFSNELSLEFRGEHVTYPSKSTYPASRVMKHKIENGISYYVASLPSPLPELRAK